MIKKIFSVKELVESGEWTVSDGYHTFDELYDHRIELYLAFCRQLASLWSVWRSERHADGSTFPGWFVMGIGEDPGEQITYHLPMARWNDASFAQTREYAPPWDGHTPADILERLKQL